MPLFRPVVVVFAVIARSLGLHRMGQPVDEKTPIPSRHRGSGRMCSLHSTTSLECFFTTGPNLRQIAWEGSQSGDARLLDRRSKEGRIGGVVEEVVLPEQTVKLLNRKRIVSSLE